MSQSVNDEPVPQKVCKDCLVSKPITMFHVHRTSLYGVGSKCKVCFAKYWAVYYNRNKNRRNEYDRQYYHSHAARILELKKVRRAERPMEDKARGAVNRAVLQGRLSRQPCDICSSVKTDFHHTNGYEKENWFVGRWLCRAHHNELHRTQRLNAIGLDKDARPLAIQQMQSTQSGESK